MFGDFESCWRGVGEKRLASRETPSAATRLAPRGGCADASRHSQRARASEPRHAHDVRVHRRRGVRAGRQAARDGRPRDAGQPGRPRPPRARVPRGHQGPPRFVENPRNPRTFPTPEEMRNPTGEGGGVEAAPFPPPPGLRGETLLSARARRKPRAATPRAPRAATRARRRRLRENRAESPKVNKKGKPGAFLFTRSSSGI